MSSGTVAVGLGGGSGVKVGLEVGVKVGRGVNVGVAVGGIGVAVGVKVGTGDGLGRLMTACSPDENSGRGNQEGSALTKATTMTPRTQTTNPASIKI